MRPTLLSLCLVASLAAGCGGDDARAPEPDPRPDAGGTAETVIRAWSGAMRRGDVAAASRLFAVPSVIANGTAPVTLGSRAAVRAFHDALPCGSTVVATEPHQGVTIATFTLTERPGAQCNGTGGTARTAFEIRGGKIVRWIRVPDGDAAPPAGGRIV